MPLDAVLPAFLIALAGYAAGRKLDLDVNTLSRVCLFLLTPALAFDSLATSTISLGDAWRLAVCAFLMPFILWAAFGVLSKFLKWDDRTSRSMSLPALFTNAGNYGLPVLLFAFGQEGMDLGVIVMVMQTILVSTLGVYLAASGSMDSKKALRQVFRMPALYAMALGISIRVLHIPLPAIIARPVGLLSGATVPVYLLVLGLQLARAKGSLSVPITCILAVFRLVASPGLVGLFGFGFGLRGLPLKVLIIEAGMPAAVNTIILANEFDADPAGVSRVTLVTTLASVLSLTLWIMLLS